MHAISERKNIFLELLLIITGTLASTWQTSTELDYNTPVHVELLGSYNPDN